MRSYVSLSYRVGTTTVQTETVQKFQHRAKRLVGGLLAAIFIGGNKVVHN